MNLQQYGSMLAPAVANVSRFKNPLTAGHPVGFWFRWAWWGVTGQDQGQTSTDHHGLDDLSWPHRSSYRDTEA